jgi:hypothetical protein
MLPFRDTAFSRRRAALIPTRPRHSERRASQAPGGTLLGLVMTGYTHAKFFVDMLSGFLLATYCPETGPRDCREMWLIIGAMALITPIGLIAFRRFLQTGQARSN